MNDNLRGLIAGLVTFLILFGLSIPIASFKDHKKEVECNYITQADYKISVEELGGCMIFLNERELWWTPWIYIGYGAIAVFTLTMVWFARGWG